MSTFQNADNEEYHCVNCPRPDSAEDMVQCDSCDVWWHYSCANVDESVKDVAWVCPGCRTPDIANSTRNSQASRSVSEFAESLSKLREKQELERARVDLELRRKHLEEEQQLLDSSLALEESQSNRTRRSGLRAEQRVRQWMNDIPASAMKEKNPKEIAPSTALTVPQPIQLMAKRFDIVQQSSDPVYNAPPSTSKVPSSSNPPTVMPSYQPVQTLAPSMARGALSLSTNAQQIPSTTRSRDFTSLQSKTVSELARILERLQGIPDRPTEQLKQLQEQVNSLHLSLREMCNFSKEFDPRGTETTPNQQLRSTLEPIKNNVPRHVTTTNENNPRNQVPTNSGGLVERNEINLIPPFDESNAPQTQYYEEVAGCQSRTELPLEIPISSQLPSHSKFVSHQASVPMSSLPTQQQLTARQSLARDLPTFTGDPAEWPIFISHYKYTTEACGFTDGENMLRLQRCLKGPALNAVRSRLLLPSGVSHVIEALHTRYGRPELLINALLHKVRTIPAPKSDKLEGLIEFGTAVQELCYHIEAADATDHLSNLSLLQELVAKLPTEQKMLWARYKRDYSAVNLKTFGDYMSAVATDASSVVTYEPDYRRTVSRDNAKQKGFLNSHAEGTMDPENFDADQNRPKTIENTCVICNKSGHRVRECDQFKSLTVDGRWQKVRALGICQNCRRPCWGKKRCEVDGCDHRHHPLLHSPKESKMEAPSHILTHQLLESPTLFRIVPVTLYGAKGSIDVFAFCDEGSDLTLMEGDLVEKLGIIGTTKPLCLRWTAETSRIEHESQMVSFEISGIDHKRKQSMCARTVKHLGLPTQSFLVEEAIKHHPHLKGIPLRSYQNAKPSILIGIDNLHLSLPLKTKEGKTAGPVAVKTRLGWCVYGQRCDQSNVTHNLHVCECSCDEDLHESVKRFFVVESANPQSEIPASKEDQRALMLLETFTRRVGNRFESPLLWKSDFVEFPDSYPMAVRRLECLERRMKRDPELKESLHRQIGEYVKKGYAHVASQTELESADPRRIWYLPLGAVKNPKKPGKIRVIWDAAAKVDGVSLNSKLLKGPDQLATLPAVLFGFRQYRVAITTDVKEMFHQVLIRQEDKHSQRFLWRSQPSEKPDIYLMDVATFGRTCSPATAQFIKNRNAELHAELFPLASQAITNDTYVDDYLSSFGTEADAVRVAREMREIQNSAGFHLHNWRSNYSQVLDQLGENSLVNEKHLDLTEGSKIERVLGMLWNPSEDELGFSTQMSKEVTTMLENETRPTKRQILRCVMTLFDPLGILAPFIIHGKVLIQDLWRAGTDWDNQASDEIYEKWTKWIKMIEFISTVRVPRCYFPEATEETYHDCEFHVFVDASETAYACAVYLRTKSKLNSAQCCLVTAKSKVAPLKPWSIPRVAEILDFSTSNDWRWGPPNPTPQTKPRNGEVGHTSVEIVCGSAGQSFYSFLNRSGHALPKTYLQQRKRYGQLYLITTVSRTVAYVLRYLAKLKNQSKIVGHPQQPELRAAEETIWKLVQREVYGDEIYRLEHGPKDDGHPPTVGKHSAIYKLAPFLDERGVLRQCSRIRAVTNIHHDTRYPIILPSKHYVTKLLIEHYHRIYQHRNFETIVNEMRQIFEIPRLRVAVKKISHNCALCKLKRARPVIPPMAPLPAARLAHHKRAFTYTGVDYFGPLLVRVGRSAVKRWVALFTCLTTRAVHLEIAYTLTTASCISTIRRFVGRRGSPREFFSDSGTNFQCAERVLRTQISQGLSETFTSSSTSWTFIPPGAPHMGGAWERLVQSVKAAMNDSCDTLLYYIKMMDTP
ncbi:uncharacterized protein LOC129738331 [Uranotaenia lowii]|uniref:uncharacterized protein LOC129738331 n=1 Tax=Uranotaenia lowii TaxID=190385 RepID=UPI00247AA28E|nr:uncharacterized protein LOC129738331 [Uranotaenia lowii]